MRGVCVFCWGMEPREDVNLIRVVTSVGVLIGCQIQFPLKENSIQGLFFLAGLTAGCVMACVLSEVHQSQLVLRRFCRIKQWEIRSQQQQRLCFVLLRPWPVQVAVSSEGKFGLSNLIRQRQKSCPVHLRLLKNNILTPYTTVTPLFCLRLFLMLLPART